jgi:hypothetical protein
MCRSKTEKIVFIFHNKEVRNAFLIRIDYYELSLYNLHPRNTKLLVAVWLVTRLVPSVALHARHVHTTRCSREALS